MQITSRTVSFLLAFSVALLTFLFLSLVDNTPWEALVVAITISFAATFLLSFMTLEFLIFREVNRIYENLENIARAELEHFFKDSQTQVSTNPLKRLNQEIQTYAKLKESEIEKLRRLEAYRKEFIADISHELKTPIFAAQGYILTLLDGAIDDEKVKYKFLKKAAKSLNGLNTVVQDLMTLSQIESGVIVMQFEVFDIQSLTMDVCEQLESKAQKRNISLRLQKINPEGVFVNADFNRMTQVMTNLINNGIKYGKEGGWVEIGFLEQGETVEIAVKDNGVGIPPEHVDRVFERFYRVDKSRSKKQGGTGLGLAIVKHILEGHNTRATINSVVEVGTTFAFKLQRGRVIE